MVQRGAETRERQRESSERKREEERGSAHLPVRLVHDLSVEAQKEKKLRADHLTHDLPSRGGVVLAGEHGAHPHGNVLYSGADAACLVVELCEALRGALHESGWVVGGGGWMVGGRGWQRVDGGLT